MIDSKGMAELHGIQDLEEDTLDQWVVTNEISLVGDAGEQIALGTEFNDHIGTVNRIHDANQGNHIWMLAGHMVQFNFPLLVLQLAGVESGLVESFDGIHNIGMDVDGSVDNPIGPDTQDASKLQPVG